MNPAVVTDIAPLRDAVAEARRRGRTIGLVPTMGALHAGHLSLIEAARAENGCVVVSIFVNPTQFGPNEDLNRYPRPLEHDLELCGAAGVDLVFHPRPEVIYPPGYRTFVEVTGLQDVLCGASRLEDWDAAEFAAVERIVEVAQRAFDFVVLDLGSFYSAEWQNELQASEVLLVSEADLPGLGKLQRHLAELANLKVPSTRLRLVINRWHKHDEEALEKVEKDMRIPVFARVPNDFKHVTNATLRGVTVDQGSDSLSCSFQEMASRFAGKRFGGESKKSLLTQLFSFSF